MTIDTSHLKYFTECISVTKQKIANAVYDSNVAVIRDDGKNPNPTDVFLKSMFRELGFSSDDLFHEELRKDSIETEKIEELLGALGNLEKKIKELEQLIK